MQETKNENEYMICRVTFDGYIIESIADGAKLGAYVRSVFRSAQNSNQIEDRFSTVILDDVSALS